MSTDDLYPLRSQVCHLAADWLATVGDHLWVIGILSSEQETEAVGVLAQMIGQLGQEATGAFDRERYYAAAALVRQIVEAQYLMAVFRDDAKQRARWLNASTNRIEKSFRPGQMREAGGFTISEYKQHCSWGGHPNPSARWMLPNHTGFPVAPDLLIVDLGQHLTEAVDLLVSVLPTLPMVDLDTLPSQGDLPETYRRWRAEDPMSGRITIPTAPPTSRPSRAP